MIVVLYRRVLQVILASEKALLIRRKGIKFIVNFIFQKIRLVQNRLKALLIEDFSKI